MDTSPFTWSNNPHTSKLLPYAMQKMCQQAARAWAGGQNVGQRLPEKHIR